MLELVLCLPLLLAVMALVINFGTVASWKVRALAASRHSVWSTRWPRNGQQMPRPDYWPSHAGMGAHGLGPLHSLDDLRVAFPVIRGPLPYGSTVNDQLLNPGRGLREGVADLERRFPLFRQLAPYRLRPETRVFSGTWDHREMGLFTTHERRIPVIYQLARAPQWLVEAYRQAALAILNAPFRPALMPLDRDDEFIGYAQRFGWPVGAPDFHPPLHRFCGLDHAVAQERVDDLVERIEGRLVPDGQGGFIRQGGVAQNIVMAFIALYQRVIQQLQQPPWNGPGAAAEILALQQRIAVLQQFLAQLQRM